MTYKTNTPNYNTKSNKIANYKDFFDNLNKEKEELKKSKRNYKSNDDETHKIPGNRKLRFDKITRKYTNTSLGEVEDKIDQIDSLQETKDVLKINKGTVNKYATKYSENNSSFKSRGFSEGVSILLKENDLEKAKKTVLDIIDNIEDENKYNSLSDNERLEIKQGMEDFIKYIDNGFINESHFC